MTHAHTVTRGGQTSHALAEAMQIMAENARDEARATMINGDFGHIDIIDRKTAESLATVLVDERLRFTCETTEQERWRFRILPESVARVCVLANLPQRRADD